MSGKKLGKKGRAIPPINIVVPMAGGGASFKEAGFTFPKPLIEIAGRPMIEIVVHNLKPRLPHRFIFVCLKDHLERFDLHNIFKKATADAFEIVKVSGPTKGAACSVLTALPYINNERELIIANGDQIIDVPLDAFVSAARKRRADGAIMTFPSSHPRWSYARLNKEGDVIETAEKRVISDTATVGVYYFKRGRDFVKAAESMIEKNITHQGEFYVCPVFNELIITGARISSYPIALRAMHGLGTPDDLRGFIKEVETGRAALKPLPVR